MTKREKNNNPLFPVDMPLEIERHDNTMCLRMNVANGDYKGFEFDVAWSNLTLVIGVKDKNKEENKGRYVTYGINLKDLVSTVIDRIPEFDKTEKIPLKKEA